MRHPAQKDAPLRQDRRGSGELADVDEGDGWRATSCRYTKRLADLPCPARAPGAAAWWWRRSTPHEPARGAGRQRPHGDLGVAGHPAQRPVLTRGVPRAHPRPPGATMIVMKPLLPVAPRRLG